MFMVAGSTSVVRVNGVAHVTADAQMRARFERDGAHPRSVILIEITEVYFQCSRAIMRAGLWTSGDEGDGLPTAGEMLKGTSGGEVGGAEYDSQWPERARKSMW